MAQPNILVVMVDQMTHDVIGGLGHPAVLTPNLDALVRGGVAFTNAYCNSPICVPARAAFMSGRLPRHTRVYDNGSELPASMPTLAHHLNRAGYTTILAGKMHFVGPDQLHGFKERLTTDISPSAFDLTPDWTRGAYPNPGTSVSRLSWSPVHDWTLQLAYDEEVLHCALTRLRALREEAGPFFLCASFSHPHDPFQITQAYWDLYGGRDIPPPRAPAPEEHHPFNQWIQIHHEADRFPLGERETQQARRAYYAMVSYADQLLGQLMRELERLAMGDTLVIFTSDHGEMLGEHGMWLKRTFYEAATKVPLIFYHPGRLEPARRDEVVSLVDLTATLADLAEAPDRGDWQTDGDSFRALLEGREAPWKDSAVSEYLAEGTIQPMLMLRKGRYKYVYVHEHAPLLFDLEADPLELDDLAHKPAYQALGRKLEDELLAGLDPAALRRDILQSQRERRLIASAMPGGAPWAYQTSRNAAKLYVRPKP